MYDFQTRINRRGTSCAKWDQDKKRTGREGLLPLWVADMDFHIAPEIQVALEKRLVHGVFGYTFRPESLDDALINWFSERHDWKISRDEIVEAPGIVPFIHMAIQKFSQPNDAIVIQEPVYYPFRLAIENNGRQVVNNPLKQDAEGKWHMDLPGLAKVLDDSSAKLLVFCSPHNPVGRVWQENELLALADLCRDKGVILISDEIHADLVHPGYRHTPWLTLPAERRPKSISLVSATKTFNLPGFTTAYAIIEDPELRDETRKMLKGLGMGGSESPLAYAATESAWRDGADWLDALLKHLRTNDELLRTKLAAGLPQVKVSDLEGTYLEWLDLRALGLEDRNIWNRVLDAGVWPSRGSQFGKTGECFLRVNIACPSSQLEEGLDRIITALQS